VPNIDEKKNFQRRVTRGLDEWRRVGIKDEERAGGMKDGR
jgi:hypothetical protein